MLLSKGTYHGINDRSGEAEKKISINFSKAKTEFCLSLHYIGYGSYLYVNKTEIYKFKANHNISWYNFYSGGMIRVKFL